MAKPRIAVHQFDLPVTYADGLAYQARAVDELLAARSHAHDESRVHTPAGHLFVIRHTPTITIGRHGGRDNIIFSEDVLRQRGITLVETDRGGNITFHGPNQWTVYPVFDLTVFGRDVAGHIRKLEQLAINVMAAYGVAGHRVEGKSGAWAGSGNTERKLCAVGIAVRRWIASHGIGFNVFPDDDLSGAIIPCGIRGRGVTSLAEETVLAGGFQPDMAGVADRLIDETLAVFDAVRSA